MSTKRQPRLLILALAPVLLASECGPTNQEIGAAVLCGLAPVPLVELLILAGLMVWLRRLVPGNDLPSSPATALFWGLLLLVHLGAGGVPFFNDEVKLDNPLARTAFLLVGSFHLGLTLVTWRILAAWRVPSGGLIAPWVGALATLIPAWLMFGDQISEEAGDQWQEAWVYGSLGGWAGPAVLLLVLIEFFVRSRHVRARRA